MAPGSGAKNGTPRISFSRSTSGAVASLSIRINFGPKRTMSTGTDRPVMISVVLMPRPLINAGAMIAPTPIVVIQMSWSTPKTRARTASGTARWTSVKPATSTTVLPSPVSAKATIATAVYDATPMRATGNVSRRAEMMKRRSMSATIAAPWPACSACPVAPCSMPACSTPACSLVPTRGWPACAARSFILRLRFPILQRTARRID